MVQGSTYKNGLMLFSEPGQVVSWDTLTFWDGYAFVFHPDLIKNHTVANRISQYRYFSYEVSDALFMKSEEEETITWLFTKIHLELLNSKHNANTEVILSLLNVVFGCLFYFYHFPERSLIAGFAQILHLLYQLKMSHFCGNSLSKVFCLCKPASIEHDRFLFGQEVVIR